MNPTSSQNALSSFIFSDVQLHRIASAIDNAILGRANKASQGVILQALMGGGKTSILLSLLKMLQSQRPCQYLDCATLSLTDRGRSESMLLQCIDTDVASFLMVDNIDCLPSASFNSSEKSALTTSSPSFTSALRSAIDNGNVFVIATCTNAKAIDPSLVQDYRLGKPVELTLPTKPDREAIIQRYLMDSNIIVANDAPASMMQTCGETGGSTYETNVALAAKELALHTQGCSACDINKFLREQHQRAVILTATSDSGLQPALLEQPGAKVAVTNASVVSLSVSQLLQAATLLSPVALQSSAKGAVQGFVRQIDLDAAEPVLVGVDEVKQRLLRCISTVVPEILASEVIANRSHTRKCSGIVLHGPSGAGKTALTDWLAYATRRHCKFLSVPCADLVHKVVGETERRLAQIFETARELSPCIVLLDNIDMLLGASAQDSSHNAGNAAEKGTTRHRSARTRHHAVDRMLSTLLVEIDGIYTSSSSSSSSSAAAAAAPSTSKASGSSAVPRGAPSVLVVVTTTSMNCLDRALIRPGRLEEHISLALPAQQQRAQLLMSLFHPPQPLSADQHTSEETARILAFAEECARYTSGRSYAHIKALCQEANIAFARETLFVRLREGAPNLSISSSSAEKTAFVCKYMIDHTKSF